MHTVISHASQFRDAFHYAGRANQFSYEALGLLFDYFDDTDPDMELDVIAVCCHYLEESVDEIAQAYGIDLTECSDGVCTASAYGLERVAKNEHAVVMEWLQNNTQVVGCTSSGIVYCSSF